MEMARTLDTDLFGKKLIKEAHIIEKTKTKNRKEKK
jgi:hypothetical protein